MTERPVLAIGLMSGTSLDGMDAALVRLEGPARAHLLAFETRPYASAERALLEKCLHDGSSADFARLHVQLGVWACEAVDQVLATGRTRASTLDFIAFPGQTLWHEPGRVSWQLGEPAVLAERFGVRVVSGFRARDVAAGGEGAPLVPMADVLLFGAPDHARILLNIGGMANVTFVPRREADHGVLAFDTGPGMVLIDALARRHDPALPFDRDGAVAAAGRVDEATVTAVLADPWFHRSPPKSTGREHFGDGLVGQLGAGPDAVATAVEITVRSIADAITRWLPAGSEILVSGGGTRHPVLRKRLDELLAPRTVRDFSDVYFSGDAKEAVAFAHLGYLTVHGQPGNLPEVTGARGPRVLGSITPA